MWKEEAPNNDVITHGTALALSILNMMHIKFEQHLLVSLFSCCEENKPRQKLTARGFFHLSPVTRKSITNNAKHTYFD